MKKILKQFCRFSVVGVVAFLIDYGLLFTFTDTLHMHYLLSSMLSFSVATVFNYVYSTKYVFECKEEQNKAGQFTVFLLLSACGLLLNSILMKTLVENMELHYMFAKLFSAVVVSIWNFASRKIFLEERVMEKLFTRRQELLRDR
ncbi:GtrA family protein [Roseburia sp. 499]|uniref:GtrA family protein n=1 Tax=Roseburia sp. 499 TaxID=1261634 RepID=UPI000952153D|nr:GtrA family protein [Roseburia sp. 499]WVK69258.1 GtrA family protein [Roseburia sp. 499]